MDHRDKPAISEAYHDSIELTGPPKVNQKVFVVGPKNMPVKITLVKK